MKPQYIQQLRKEAEEQAKQILKNQKSFNNKEFDAKYNISKKRTSTLHSLIDQKDIDYCLNNDLDIAYLYTEMASKYGGDVEKEKKQYYIPTGAKRGRPKKEDNELQG
jgi:hypothetical protein